MVRPWQWPALWAALGESLFQRCLNYIINKNMMPPIWCVHWLVDSLGGAGDKWLLDLATNWTMPPLAREQLICLPLRIEAISCLSCLLFVLLSLCLGLHRSTSNFARNERLDNLSILNNAFLLILAQSNALHIWQCMAQRAPNATISIRSVAIDPYVLWTLIDPILKLISNVCWFLWSAAASPPPIVLQPIGSPSYWQ